MGQGTSPLRVWAEPEMFFFDVLKNEEIKNFGVGSTTTPIEKKECKSANRVQIDCQSQ